MLGNTRGGRGAAWVGAFGAVLLVVALVSPGPQGAGAASESPTQSGARSGRPVTLVASAQTPTTAPAVLDRALELRLIVAPAGGADLGVYDAPGAATPSQVLPAVNELGSPLVLLAVEHQGDWYRVLLPTRPNGSSAWVPVNAVVTTAPAYEVEASLSTLTLHVVRIADEAVVFTSAIGIGSPAKPTPTGVFFVRDHFPTDGAPDHPYGPFAFGLSGHSEVDMHFGTGDARIAIHGTNQPSSIGAAVSNGCVHVPNDVVLDLIPYLPLGTPVTITP